MSENKRLTPTWIIYVDGRRLDTAHEGALRSIEIVDRLNGVSTFTVVFYTAEVKVREQNLISLESEISIHMGYKDDVEEVFSGEVLAFRGIFPENNAEQLEVSGCNALHKLSHASRFRGFEEKKPSEVIEGLLDGYSLKAEVDDFGVPRLYQSEESQTDWEYLREQAKAHGKQVYATGSTVYVKDEISVRSDEIIYEWGKSLMSFKAHQDISGLVSRVDYIGWDHLKNESFTDGAALKDLPLKIGGPKDWGEVSKGGSGKFEEAIVDMNCRDSDEAKQLALGRLQGNSYRFGFANGKGDGNCRLRPGMRVTAKAVGESFEGEYTAFEVTHKFDTRSGYTTEFILMRNMCP